MFLKTGNIDQTGIGQVVEGEGQDKIELINQKLDSIVKVL
jgi:hypothetical protein